MSYRSFFALIATLSLVACHDDDDENFEFSRVFDCLSVASAPANLLEDEFDPTPLSDAGAEHLAREATGAFTAPPSVYERVVAELGGIRSQFANLNSVGVMPCYSSSVNIFFDTETWDRVTSGTYTGWNALNERLGATGTTLSQVSRRATVFFDGRYNMPRVAEAYSNLDGVEQVAPNGIVGDGNDICLAIRGSVHFYIFDIGEGDCPAGCINHEYTAFNVDDGGNIRWLGRYVPGPDAAPDWFRGAEDCRQFL